MGENADKTRRLERGEDAADELRGRVGGRPLLLVYHRQGIRVVALAEGLAVVIGREPSAADVAIADASLSRRHAAFTVRDGHIWVEDLGSTNGTLVNGQALEGPQQVGPQDSVVLGAIGVALHEPQPGRDDRIGLDSHEHFRQRLAEETTRAQAFRRTLALVVLQAQDQLAGQIACWSARVTRGLRAFERAGLYSEHTVELLLPESSAEQAESLVRRIVAQRGDNEPALRAGIAMLPEAATSPEELLELALEAVRAADANSPVRRAPSRISRGVSTDPSAPELIRSTAMEPLCRTIDRLAASVIPVLIQGETGCGKEVVARAIHSGGVRAERPMICVNCGAIPAQLVESTLFGHEKGAFTGAAQQAVGVFEAAKGGTVLLDEIGELPAGAQAALLRVLESKRITRVGSPREIEVDARVLASTHCDLEAMCRAGDFRWDLLYRLNAMTLKVPPLRERCDEIPELANRFLQEASTANHRPVDRIDDAALDLLRIYDWPGNVRELRNAIERAVVIAESSALTADDLPEPVRDLVDDAPTASPAASPSPAVMEPETAGISGAKAAGESASLDFRERTQHFECEILLEALRAADWDRARAAELLGLPLRTMAHKMKSHGIKRVSYDQRGSGG